MKELTAFRIDANLLEGLRWVKERDGVGLAEQVEKAVASWLETMNATPEKIYQLFDEFEHQLGSASRKDTLAEIALATGFGESLKGQFLSRLSRPQMLALERLARAAHRPTRAYWDLWRAAKFRTERGLRQAFDAPVINALEHLLRGYNPHVEPNEMLRAQHVSLLQLYFYGTSPYVLPTVEAALQKGDKDVLLWAHHQLLDVQSRDLREAVLEERVVDLAEHYPGKASERGRRIVAEAEQVDFDVLVTFDEQLIEHLTPYTSLLLAQPFDCWRRMRVREGSEPRLVPAHGHPLFGTDFWKV